MPERFTPRQNGFNSNSRRQSPVNYDNDRYTPPADPYPNRQNPPSPPIKTSYQQSRNAPESYHVDTKNDNPRSKYDDKPLPPLAENSHSRAMTNQPELYHLNTTGNPAQSMNDYPPRSPPIQTAYTLSETNGPEFYHLSHNENNVVSPDLPPPAALKTNNRISPVPMETFPTDRKIELFSIQKSSEPFHSPPPPSSSPPPIHNTSKFNDKIVDQEPGKIVMYTLTAKNQENQSPSLVRERTPSPYVRIISSKQSRNLFIFQTIPTKTQPPVKQTPFPTSLRDVPSNIRYVPLSQSKASESIQRSMMKYRFNAY